MTKVASFFKLPVFAVVGASSDRAKFGNKVLRCYVENGRKAVPVNKSQTMIENLPCVPSLTALTEMMGEMASTVGPITSNSVGVSIITPPQVTKQVLLEGMSLGYMNYFLQPGTTNDEVDETIKELRKANKKVNIIEGCVLVEFGFDEHS